MLPEWFIYIGTFISFVGGFSYARLTFLGKIQPNRLSWSLLFLIGIIAFFAALSEGVGRQALLSFIVGFNPFIIVVASFFNKKAYWRITSFDYLCGVFAIIAIIVWQLSGNGVWAIFFAIIADFSAALPIFKKAYTHPLSESYIVFLFGTINSVLVLLTISNWNFATYAFPLYIFFFNMILIMIIVSRRKILHLSRKKT